MTSLGHITGPLWKHPFINTIIHYTALVVPGQCQWYSPNWHCTSMSLKQMSYSFNFWSVFNVNEQNLEQIVLTPHIKESGVVTLLQLIIRSNSGMINWSTCTWPVNKKFHTVNPKKKLSICSIRREGFHCKIVNQLVYFWRKLFLFLNYKIFGHIGLPNVSLPHYLLDCRQLCINTSHFSKFCGADDEISASSWISHDYLHMKFE